MFRICFSQLKPIGSSLAASAKKRGHSKIANVYKFQKLLPCLSGTQVLKSPDFSLPICNIYYIRIFSVYFLISEFAAVRAGMCLA